MEYRINIQAFGTSAKNKGIITGRATSTSTGEQFAIIAHSPEDAYNKVAALYRPTDRRPLSGKSYVRKCALKPRKVGDKVRTLLPYAARPGVFAGYRDGVVTEVVDARFVSVGFPGYHTQHVDFNLSELE